MEKSLGRERNLKEVCFEFETKNIGKEEEFRVSGKSEFQNLVDQWQRTPFCQVMIGHWMEWKEFGVNQNILWEQNVTEMKDYCKNM